MRRAARVLVMAVVAVAVRLEAAPPDVPSITGIVNDTGTVWSNGVPVAGYVKKGDYRVYWSASAHEAGIHLYHLEEARDAAFTDAVQAWLLPATELSYQHYLKTNGAYFYRVKAEAVSGETSDWSAVVGKTVSMAEPSVPTVPAIAKIERNIQEEVWSNGVLVAGYVHQADYRIDLSISRSGDGIDFYEIQEATNEADFVSGTNFATYLPHFPDLEYPAATNPMYQVYLKPNGTYWYRVRAVDVNGFRSGWSTVAGTQSNITVSLPLPVPPSTPVITSITNNIIRGVISNGSSIVTHTNRGDYVINISTSAAGAGINVYEIQETTNPAHFAYVDQFGYPAEWFTNPTPPVAVISPHFPDLAQCASGNLTFASCTNPVYQFFLKPNGTYHYRVRAKDLNGFISSWSATQVFTVAMAEPYPPSVPALATNSLAALDGDLIIGFPPSASGGNINAYEIQLSTSADFSTGVTVVYSGSPGTSFTGLPEGTYYVRVRAEDWNGFKSAWSPVRSVDVVYPDIANVRVTHITNDTALVEWETDVPSTTEVERRGMFKVFDTWRDPDEFVQGVLYAPAEAYGAAITTNDVEYDLQQFKTNNINLINLYNLGWSELQQNGNVEDFLFRRAGELGIKIVVRLETYNKYNDKLPIAGDNTPEKHYAYRPEDADWIIDYYTRITPVFGTNGYTTLYPDAIKYIVINMPFDDPELRRQDGIGLNDWPDKDRQRSYIAAFYGKIKAVNPTHPVYVNLGFGGQDRDPHFGVADLVDGISEHVYTVRLDYYTRCYGYIPGVEDADYLLMNQDVYDYYLEKMYDVNDIAHNGRPVIIDQTGYCEINDFTTGLVKDKRAKARACTLLRDYLANHPHCPNGWTYFMAFDKFNEGGEQATWGLIDRLNQFVDFFDEPGTNWTVAAGGWSVATGVYISAGSGNDKTLTAFGQKKGTIEAAFNSGHGTGTNLYIVFSYVNSNSYRYAGYDGEGARWLIAEVTNGTTNILASKAATNSVVVAPDSEYALRVVINFNSVRLDVGLTRKIVEHTFPTFTQGRIGLMTRGSAIAFPSFKIFGRVYLPEPVTNHSFQLNTLFPGTEYTIRALSGGAVSAFTNFISAPEAPIPPRPAITVVTPAYGNVATAGVFDIQWKALDPAGDAYIDLYYTRYERASAYNNENPSNRYEATLIATNIKASHGVVGHYLWDPSGVMPGNYYILARIYRPGSGQPDEFDYSSGQLVLTSRRLPVVRTAATNIVIDGVPDEPAWAEADPHAYASGGFGATETVARVKLLWDDVNLYVAYDVDDAELAAADSYNNSDSVFCFIHNGRPSLNFLDITGRQSLMDPDGLDHDRPIGSFAAISNRPGGYTAEMKIRWDSLRVIPDVGDIIPADFKVVDRTAAGQVMHVSWDPNNDDWLAGRVLELIAGAPGLPPARDYTIGINNGVDADFAQGNFKPVFHADRMDSLQFAKELNATWYATQHVVFTAGGAFLARGAAVVLDPAWDNGNGRLTVRVDVDSGGGFVTAGAVEIDDVTRGVVMIPPTMLAPGTNTLRLVGVSGDNGTDALTWDQIRIVEAFLDSDQDGMPDGWEIGHGLSENTAADASADPDSDGMSNAAEWAADTDPHSASSYLALDSVSISQGQVRVEWRSGSNAWQYLDAGRSSATGTTWSTVYTGVPPTGPGAHTFDPTTETFQFRVRTHR
jgi:hypothetical protein